MSDDEATRMIYEYRLKMARDERAKMQDAREEGLTKGMEEERKKNAKAMKAEEIDVNTIARVTGLTVDDILKM
jgi:predicted transposase/invertase (TIGR01784 family)